jgi:hypothetical protein
MTSAMTDTPRNTIIYVRLLNEGSPASRPTQAQVLENGFYKLLATPNYDPTDEEWEFPPGAVVRAKAIARDGETYSLAIAP